MPTIWKLLFSVLIFMVFTCFLGLALFDYKAMQTVLKGMFIGEISCLLFVGLKILWEEI